MRIIRTDLPPGAQYAIDENYPNLSRTSSKAERFNAKRKKLQKIYPDGHRHCIVCNKEYSIIDSHPNKRHCRECSATFKTYTTTKHCNSCGDVMKRVALTKDKWTKIQFCAKCRKRIKQYQN